jgi:NAD(P)-dependent dehydrogenase (short-subunit alcohol dehydrogenase family)
MGTIAVTGSASGIGRATRQRLEAAGERVLGVDLRDADVTADLATPAGRAAAIAAVRRGCDDRLDGLVACAGVGPHVEPTATIVSLNYFGAIAILAGLRHALARGTGGAAVAVSSNSSSLPHVDAPLVQTCLAGDEDAARQMAADLHGTAAYAAAKRALALWVRRHAPSVAWAGASLRLNGVVPGAVRTPLLQAGLDRPGLGDAIRGFPIPLGGFGAPEQIAAAIAFLLSDDAAFCCGTLLFVDGGTDALLRPDQY